MKIKINEINKNDFIIFIFLIFKNMDQSRIKGVAKDIYQIFCTNNNLFIDFLSATEEYAYLILPLLFKEIFFDNYNPTEEDIDTLQSFLEYISGLYRFRDTLKNIYKVFYVYLISVDEPEFCQIILDFMLEKAIEIDSFNYDILFIVLDKLIKIIDDENWVYHLIDISFPKINDIMEELQNNYEMIELDAVLTFFNLIIDILNRQDENSNMIYGFLMENDILEILQQLIVDGDQSYLSIVSDFATGLLNLYGDSNTDFDPIYKFLFYQLDTVADTWSLKNKNKFLIFLDACINHKSSLIDIMDEYGLLDFINLMYEFNEALPYVCSILLQIFEIFKKIGVATDNEFAAEAFDVVNNVYERCLELPIDESAVTCFMDWYDSRLETE